MSVSPAIRSTGEILSVKKPVARSSSRFACCKAPKRILCSRTQHHALTREVPVLPCKLNRCPWCKPIVDPELSRVQPARYIRNVDLPLRIPQTPSSHRKATANNRLCARCSLRPCHRVLIASAVSCAKEKRTIDAVYATSKPHDDIVIAVYLAHRLLCALERPEGMIGSAVGGVVSRGRDCDRNRLGTARLRTCRGYTPIANVQANTARIANGLTLNGLPHPCATEPPRPYTTSCIVECHRPRRTRYGTHVPAQSRGSCPCAHALPDRALCSFHSMHMRAYSPRS